MSLYKIEKTYFENVTPHQREEMLAAFDQDKDGNIVIPYEHKGYTCKDIKVDRSNGIKAISMFSGAGGLDIGTQLAGIPVLSSLDIFEDSVKTMQQNSFFKDTLHECGDITRIDGTHYAELLKKENPDKLILVGGPPCQPFSKAGYWVTNEKRNSSEDPRNLIVPYFKIISDLRPDGFVLENVESILHPSNHEAVETIAENMERLGYHYSMLKINAAEYGIPQKRNAVVVAWPIEMDKNYPMKLDLTGYARSHMDECCLVFDLHITSKVSSDYHTACFLNRESSDVTFELTYHNGFQNAPQERQVAMRKKMAEEATEIRKQMTDVPSQCMELLLKWRGKNYTELAYDIDRDPKTISRIVKGTHTPSPDTAVLICFALNLPPIISEKLLDVFGCKLNPFDMNHQWIGEALHMKYPEPVWAVREYLAQFGVEI